jgi:hypothetical protein
VVVVEEAVLVVVEVVVEDLVLKHPELQVLPVVVAQVAGQMQVVAALAVVAVVAVVAAIGV